MPLEEEILSPAHDLYVDIMTPPTHLPQDDFFASPNFSGTQYPGPIDTTASSMTMVAEDPRLWVDALVPQQPLVPTLSGLLLFGSQPLMEHQDTSLSEPIGDTQQHSLLCASKRANSSERPDRHFLTDEGKRARRRAIEMRFRKKEQENHENIEASSKRLESLCANLRAELHALKEEKCNLMDQLLTHTHCNDSAIAEYLSSASKKM
jgi:hypothetical protein